MSDLRYPTPHIDASPNDFAKTVLMPGDPLRAKFIAENFLTDAKLVNNVRGVQGYTGFYENTRVTVMASGMGMPSMGIYSYELYNIFGVENIIRIGSAGAVSQNIGLRDIILGLGACTNSNYMSQFELNGTFAPTASFSLLEKAVKNCRSMGIEYHVGNILSTDAFYCEDGSTNEKWRKMGVLAVEMEGAALYANAARAGKNALVICTVSDGAASGKALSALERQNTLTQMTVLALKTAAEAD